MRKKTKSRLLDALIAVSGVAVCCTSIVLFVKDLNRHTIRRDKDTIASIVYKYKTAHRKFNDRVVWERLWQDAPLYNADTIRTAEQSFATITFIDGTVIDVLSSTMIQVFYNENGYYLNVGNGSVSVDTTAKKDGSSKNSVHLMLDDGSSIECETGSRVSTVTNSSIGVNSVSVQAGTASIKTISGEKDTVLGGESVTIEKIQPSVDERRTEPEVVIKRSRISIVSVPKELYILGFDHDPKRIELEWKIYEAAENSDVVVQTSLYRDFSEIIKSQTIKGRNSYYIDAASEGAMYWKVFLKDQPEVAETGKVFVDYASPVVLSSPLENAVYTFRKNFPQVSFAWSGNKYADYYRLDVSESPDMSNPVISQDAYTQRVSFDSLREGKYYWTVTPYYSENSIGYGNNAGIRSFSIQEQKMSDPPELSFPADGAVIVSDRSGADISFGWRGFEDGSEYKLLVSSKSDFSDSVYELNTSKLRTREIFDTDKVPSGSYYWKILQIDPEGEVLSSSARCFEIKDYIPAMCRLVSPPDLYEVTKNKLTELDFAWKVSDLPVEGSPECVFQISAQKDFSSVLYEQKNEARKVSGLNLDGGTYYWRVSVSDYKNDVAVISDVRQLVVLDELEVPYVIEPREKNIITLYDDRSVHCEWRAVSGADYYNLKLYDADSETVLNEISHIKGTSVDAAVTAIKMSGEMKNCYISLHAVSEENEYKAMRVSAQAGVPFKIRLRKTVRLLSPDDSESIAGLTAVRKQTEFSWRYGDPVSSSKFTLKKMQPDGTYRIFETVENPKSSVRFERLPAGFYKWTVSALSMDGRPLDAEETRFFEVRPIPVLEKPELVSPIEKTVMNGAYFKRNRYIEFSWKPVEFATDYAFVLYHKNSDGSLHNVYEQKETKRSSVKLKNLGKLDVGDFEWHVTAFSHADDGFEEQKSRESIGTFRIDFGLPSKIKTLDPGRMYGD